MSSMTIVPNQVNGRQLASGLMVVTASHVADVRKDFFFFLVTRITVRYLVVYYKAFPHLLV